MGRARVHARHGPDGLVVESNLHTLDHEGRVAAFLGLAHRLDMDCEAMRKAVDPDGTAGGGEPPDPRYPELGVLVRAARRNWQEWGDRLVAAVQKLLDEGRLTPMSATTELLLSDLLAEHRVRLVARFTGHVTDPGRFQAMVKRGDIAPDIVRTAPVDIAWRTGRRREMLRTELGRPERPLHVIVQEAIALPLSEADTAALDYVKRRAAINMRRPIDTTEAGVSRVLNDAEQAAIGGVIERAIRGGLTSTEVRQELRAAVAEAVVGNPTLINDMERVERTELAHAHNHGAAVALAAQAAAAGEPDPEVYKFVSPRACRHCRRIWGPLTAPNRYRLSEVIANGDNFGRKAADWRPVVGPIHPNCTEGPLQYFHPKIVDSVNEAAERLAKMGF